MKKTYKKILQPLLLVTLLSCSYVMMYSQMSRPNVTFLSPNAANFNLYGNIPVSMFNGTPQIDIPLYELKSDGLSVPISLSFDASGVRADQYPGWVGTNWNLNVGGVITRIVKGLQDDYNTPATFNGTERGYYYKKPLLGKTLNSDEILNITKDYKNIGDTEPDEFSFTLPGGVSGAFFLDDTGTWQARCDKNVKIYLDQITATPLEVCQHFTGTNTTSFNQFTIKTDDGIRYIFGGSRNAIEYSVSFFGQREQTIADAWYLTKIIDQANNEINFRYEASKNFISQLALNLHWHTRIIENFKPELCHDVSQSGSNVYNFISGKLIFPVYLTEISSKNGKVLLNRSVSTQLKYKKELYDRAFSFYGSNNNGGGSSGGGQPALKTAIDELDPYEMRQSFPYLYDLKEENAGLAKLKWEQLDEIVVYNSKNELFKSIKLNYSNDTIQRLFLLGISKRSSNNTPVENYTFEYNNANLLPDYFSNKLDHWGYFNGKEASLKLTDIQGGNYFNTRSVVDVNYLMYGSLRKIVYPTGGYTEFEYEPHEYIKQVQKERWLALKPLSKSQFCGGIRVKKITDFDSDKTIKNSKTYKYVDDSNISTGVLGGEIEYYYNDYRISNKETGRTLKSAVFSSNSLLPGIDNSVFNHIGYSMIKEIFADGGYIKYYYTNYDNGYLDESYDLTLNESKSVYQPYNSMSHKRGKLYKKEYYTNKNKITKKEEIEYALVGDKAYVKSLVCALNALNCINAFETNFFYEATSYKINLLSFMPTVNREILYSPENNTILGSQEQTIVYNDNKLVKSEVTKNSKNELIETLYYYYFNLIKVASDREANINDKRKDCESLYWNEKSECEVYCAEFPPMAGTGQLSVAQCMRKCSSVFNSQVNACLGQWDSDYNKSYAPYINLIEDIKASNMTALPINISKRVLKENKYYVLNSNIFLYKKDEYGNIVHSETLDFESDNKLDDKNGLFMYPHSYDQRFKSRENYTYNKSKNLVTLTNTNGISVCYLWSYNGQYPIAEIKNASYSEVIQKLGLPLIDKINSSIIPEKADLKKINDLRSLLPNAHISTYTYKLLYGIDSITNESGIITYYNYDLFGRLKETYLMENEVKKVIQSYDYKYKNQ